MNGSYGWSYYGIEAVGGDSTPGQIMPSMKTSEMKGQVSSKFILTDWPGAPDRSLTWVAAWHAVKGKGVFNISYGDGHVQAFLFPTNQRYPAQPWGATVDPGKFGWW
jgi:prepilin-type processing-associated H-X9-DG protein